MRSRVIAALLALAGSFGGAQATPSLSFLIDGDTFASPFRIDNTSTGGEFVTRFVLDLSTATNPEGPLCFDVVTGGVCRTTGASTPFSPVGGSGVTTGLMPVVIADGAQVLTMNFGDFAPGESFLWDIDVDETNSGNSTVFGNEMIGSTATIDFSDGTRLTGVISAVRTNPDAGEFVVTGITRVPEPGTLLLVAAAGLGLLSRRRRG